MGNYWSPYRLRVNQGVIQGVKGSVAIHRLSHLSLWQNGESRHFFTDIANAI